MQGTQRTRGAGSCREGGGEQEPGRGKSRAAAAEEGAALGRPAQPSRARCPGRVLRPNSCPHSRGEEGGAGASGRALARAGTPTGGSEPALGAEPRERGAAGRGQVSRRSALPPHPGWGAPGAGRSLPSHLPPRRADLSPAAPTLRAPRAGSPDPEQPAVLPGRANLPRGCERGSASQAPERTRCGRGEFLAKTRSPPVFSAQSIFCYKTVRKVIRGFVSSPLPTPPPMRGLVERIYHRS